MTSKTNVDAHPTPYQSELLRAALADEKHRIPSDANGRTLDLMLGRRWISEYTADGRLAATVRDYPGFTHFRLSHIGVNAARTAKAFHDFKEPRKPRTVEGWTCVEPGRIVGPGTRGCSVRARAPYPQRGRRVPRRRLRYLYGGPTSAST